jgi:glycosyltransferase 2 family protein
VNRNAKLWSVGWRAVICVVLLAWIFHSIFINEGKIAWENRGSDWNALSTLEQWRIAWTYGPPELARTLYLVHPGAFALSLVFMVATIFLGIFRWRMVLQVHGLLLPLGRATGISFVAHFFNSFLLGSTGGDLMKAYYAARETHHKKTEAVMTVLVDRLIGLWAMLLFAGLMMIPNGRLLLSSERIGGWALLILMLLLGCTAFLGLAFWGGVSKTIPHARIWLRRLPKGDLFERALEACRVFGREPFFLVKALAVSMALNAFCVLQVITLAHGLGLDIPVLALFVIVPMIICVSAIPITPNGLGVRENLFVFMLAVPVIGVDATMALSLSLLAYAGSLFWSLVGGVVYLGLRDREHLEEVTQAEPDIVEEQA